MKIITIGTAVIGTGAAGYNAALRLSEMGEKNVAVFTLAEKNSTSRNTGSDKQTYYKLSLAGDAPDSPAAMAKDLFAGRCVDGDTALCEAALSAQSFLHLAELGVPFPTNRYGEFVGYKTDHDTRGRATSAGPLTSKLMTECLEKAVKAAGVPIYEHLQAIRLFPAEGAQGVLFLRTARGEDADADELFLGVVCKNVVWATGGPAGIYADSVYPLGHTGTTGVALEAGIPAQNLTEWQYGLASVRPRWNVSGTYMQVLPRFVSVDSDGTEHEFLSEAFPDTADCLCRIFRKGYEWPFDSRRAGEGSSVVDLLVYRETKLRGRRVFLDFRKNPCGLAELPYDRLDSEVKDYLTRAEACFGTPIERLAHMNQPAVDLYASRGVDLHTEMLEIALCAQHCNGGLSVDLWWQTEKPGCFCAGEAAGTHGVYRPGGSALNAGQVGSLRAAQYIARRRSGMPGADEAVSAAEKLLAYGDGLCAELKAAQGRADNTEELLANARTAMSGCAAAIRNAKKMEELAAKNRELLTHFWERVGVSTEGGSLARAFTLRDTLLSQMAVLAAMSRFAVSGGGSRGSAIYTDKTGSCADVLQSEADGLFCYRLNDGSGDGSVLTVTLDPATYECTVTERPVRPLPEGGGFFENVWRRYREDGNVW